MPLQSDKLVSWASEFHHVLTEFEDMRLFFEEDEVQKFLINIYQKKCEDSLEPMFIANR